MTRFRGTHPGMRRAGTSFFTATNQAICLTRVRDFHPIPLSSEEQECVSDPISEPGRAFATKAEVFCCKLRLL